MAGGHGSRLYPTTKVISKQLLPLYDKPLIYFPISSLILAGIREVLVISSPEQIDLFQELLGSGEEFGIRLYFQTQSTPRGIADAICLGESFIGSDSVVLALGDNVFHGNGLGQVLQVNQGIKGAKIFGYRVQNPQDFGVVEIDSHGGVVSLEEKPSAPRSNFAVPGLYFFDNKVVEFAKKVEPSERGELEITSVLQKYLVLNELAVEILGRGVAWLDTGTFDGMLEASSYIKAIQDRQGLQVCSPHEIAWNLGLLDYATLTKAIEKYSPSPYARYLQGLLE